MSLGNIVAKAAGMIPGVGTLVTGAGLAMDVLPMIHDLMKGGDASPEKMDAIAKARDARVEQMMGADPSMNRQKALNAVNAELAPLLAEAEHKGPDVGELLMDAGATAAGLYTAKKAGFFKGFGGKKTNPNAPTVGGPATATEKTNGTVDASAPKLPSQADAAKATFAAPKDEPELVHNKTEEALEGVVEKPTGTGFTMPPAGFIGKTGDTGGVSPMDQSDLLRMAMAAKMRQRSRQMGAFSGAPIEMGGPVASMNLTDSMRGDSLNAQDAARMRRMLYGANGG